MYSARIKFQKSGTAAFISHLDLMKTIQKSLKRSELPIKYTQGFNPHIYISILAPISTGFESDYELFDIDFTTDTCPENAVELLNKALPYGLRALEIYQSNRPLKDIEYAVYEIRYPAGESGAMDSYFKQDVFITKESKRQTKEVKIQDYIKNITFEQQDSSVLCTALLNLGNDQLNPVYVSQALVQGGLLEGNETVRYKRIALLDKNFQNFR